MKFVRPLPSDALDVWLARIGDLDTLDHRLAEAAADLVTTMSERPEGTNGALVRFAHALGSDGWPIQVISEWVELLAAPLDRQHRKLLRGLPAHSALALGWADGYVRGAHLDMCFDATTSLVTAMVLRMRLLEVHARASAAGHAAADLYAMVLIDVDLRGVPRWEADLLLASVAESVRSVFDRGETAARVGDRVLVLADRNAATSERCEILSDRLRLDAATHRAHATVVLDELPAAVAVERYLSDLVA
jgi:hypothetical protein